MTNETEAHDLLPCPFCGGDNLEEDAIGRVSCTGCGATAPYGYHTTETWNTRADLSDAKDKRIEELEVERDRQYDQNCEQIISIAELEAKLAKAQSCIEEVHKDCKLRSVKGVVPLGFSCWRNICATIAELKGTD